MAVEGRVMGPLGRTSLRAVMSGLGAIALLSIALLAGFAGLVAAPGSLIVDGERPWVDEWHRPGHREIGNDLTGLFLPRHLWQSEHWRQAGRIPQWDPRGFAGRPNAGNPQSGLWYPPVWLAWTWGAPAAPGWLTVTHLLWSGIGACVLARAIGLGQWAAIVSGAVLMLNPYIIAQVHEGHLPHVWAASWYPWAFLGALLLRSGHRLGWLVLPTSLAMALLAGHPQEGMYLAVALGAWAAFDLLRAMSCRRWAQAARWGIALLLAIGLSAIEWLPAVLVIPWSAGPLGGEGGGGPGPYHLAPSNLLQLVSPRALGGPSDYIGRANHWETLLSIGWAPLVLAVLGGASFPDRRVTRACLALLSLSLIHAAGRAFGLASLVATLPGLGGLRVPARSLFLAATAAAILAGMGVDTLSGPVNRARTFRRVCCFAAGIALFALGLIALPMILSGEASEADRCPSAFARILGDRLFLASFLGTISLLIWRSCRPQRRTRIAPGLGLVAIAELSASAAIALPISPPSWFLDRDEVSVAIAETQPAPHVRLRAQDQFYTDLHAWRDRVEKTNLGDLFQIRHSAELCRILYPLFEMPATVARAPLDPANIQAVLDRLSVTLILSDHPPRLSIGPVVASGLRSGTEFSVIQNPTAMPRAAVVPRAKVVADVETLEHLARVDPRSAVIMTSDPLEGVVGERQPFSPAEYVPIDPDHLIVRVRTRAPGLLVVADTWMPGWSATHNGRPVPILRGNHAFRVIPLPQAGHHEVVMTYKAPGLASGAAISAGAAILVIALTWRGSSRRRPDAQTHDQSAGPDVPASPSRTAIEVTPGLGTGGEDPR